MAQPEADWAVDATLAAALVRRQHPDLAALPLLFLDEGWDNVSYRLGNDWVARFPRRREALELTRKEQTWLPLLAPRLTLPVPVPVRTGSPDLGYPGVWSIVPWLEGETADRAPPRDGATWGRFLASLHTQAPQEAPANPYRGGPLAQRAEAVAGRLGRLGERPALERLWQAGLTAPADQRTLWLHGDLHPRNVVVYGGRVTGVLDWGDLTAGDPSVDVASVWMLFADPAEREAALKVYDPDSAVVVRARAWAASFALMFLDAGTNGRAEWTALGQRIEAQLAGER